MSLHVRDVFAPDVPDVPDCEYEMYFGTETATKLVEAAEKDNELQGEVGASLDLESKELGHAMARSSSAADKRCSKEEQAEQASKTTHIKIYRLGTWSLDIAGAPMTRRNRQSQGIQRNQVSLCSRHRQLGRVVCFCRSRPPEAGGIFTKRVLTGFWRVGSQRPEN